MTPEMGKALNCAPMDEPISHQADGEGNSPPYL